MKKLIKAFLFSQRINEVIEPDFKYYQANKQSLLFRRPFGAN
jgi:hypothetical protein